MTIDYFFTPTLTRDSVPLMLSRDTSHEFVLSQISSSFECAASSYLTIVVGRK